MEMGRDFRNSETAVMGLAGKFIEAANQEGPLIVSHDRRTRKHPRLIAAQIESPDGLRRNTCVRSDSEVRIGPNPLNVEILRRKLAIKLEAVCAFDNLPIELPPPFIGATGCRVDAVVGALSRRTDKSRIRQRTRRKDWRNVKWIEEGCDRRAASQLARPRPASSRSSPGA
jgi:hypothetical protein